MHQKRNLKLNQIEYLDGGGGGEEEEDVEDIDQDLNLFITDRLYNNLFIIDRSQFNNLFIDLNQNLNLQESI